MLTAAIATSDLHTSAQLLASVQQTGLVSSIKQWMIPTERIEAGEGIPDVVLLDLGHDPEPFLTFGALIRRLRPTVRLIACSSINPPNQKLLLDAMRSGVQDFISKPAGPEELQVIFARFIQEGQAVERKSADKLIVLMGAKGGVGTTTVAVNLGVQLSTFAHKHTVLLDLARPLGNAHLLLDLNPRFGIRDAIENIDRLDSHFFDGLLATHSTKLHLLAGALHPEQWQTIPARSAESRRECGAVQLRYGSSRPWLAVRFRLDADTRCGANDSAGDGNECAGPVESRAPSAGVGGIGNQLGENSDRGQSLAQRRSGNPRTTCRKTSSARFSRFFPNDFSKASTSVNMGTPLIENHNNVLTNHYRQLASLLTGMNSAPAPKRSGISSLFSFPGKR